VSDILVETGLGSGSLYWFFRNKEDLLCAVMDGYLEKLERMLAGPALSRSADPLERITIVFGFYRGILVENDFVLGCPIGNIALELGDRYPVVREKVERLFEAWRAMIRRCLAPAAARIRPDEIESIAMFTLTVMEGGIMAWPFPREK